MNASDAFCLALDVEDAASAERWTRRLCADVGTFKIGLRLFCAEGPGIVSRIREAGARRIFLDLKLHDIPNTVAGAVGALAGRGADLLTVHAGGGEAMLRAAVDAGAKVGVAIVGVTVLTSLDARALAAVGHQRATEDLVDVRTRLLRAAGCAGVVCSPHEARLARAALGPDRLVITPGIRMADAALSDQARTATPGAARAAGADLLVIGRPILDAPEPDEALARLQANWRSGGL